MASNCRSSSNLGPLNKQTECKPTALSDHVILLTNTFYRRVESPYTISVPMQIKLCTRRGFQRLRGDLRNFLNTVLGNVGLALIIGSVFYNMPIDTSSFFLRGALLFFAVLMNAFASILEVCPCNVNSYMLLCLTERSRSLRCTLNDLSWKNIPNTLCTIHIPNLPLP